MSFNIRKALGVLLLLCGVGIIGLTLLSSYNIFIGKTPVPALFSVDIFKSDSKEQSFEEPAGKDISFEEGVQDALQQGIKDQLQGLFPSEAIVILLNLVSWSIFAGIATFGGTQIARLGINLMK